jgi:hypothetical protein
MRFGRRVAAALAGAAMLLTMLAGCGSSGSSHPSQSDSLAQELAAVANRGPRAAWYVSYAFTRTTNDGRTLHDTALALHLPARAGRPALDVTTGIGAVVVTSGTRTWSCSDVEDGPPCLESKARGTDRPGAVYGGAIVSGRYSIARADAATFAGVAAHCYLLKLLHGDPVAGLGFSSEQCYSSAGVPLRSRVQSSGALDARTATGVRTKVTRADLLPLLAPYHLERLAP